MPNPLKVLFIVHNPTRKGGVHYRGLNLGISLARREHDATLMTIHPTERWRVIERELDGVKLVETPDMLWGIGRTGWDPWDTLQRTRWIRRHRFDVIHTVDTRPAVPMPALLGRMPMGRSSTLMRSAVAPKRWTTARTRWHEPHARGTHCRQTQSFLSNDHCRAQCGRQKGMILNKSKAILSSDGRGFFGRDLTRRLPCLAHERKSKGM